MLNSNPYDIDGPFSACWQVVVCIYVAHLFCVQEGLKDILHFGSRPPQQCEYQNKASYMNFLFLYANKSYVYTIL